jgi:TP901 family phage tail tape measure protein
MANERVLRIGIDASGARTGARDFEVGAGKIIVDTKRTKREIDSLDSSLSRLKGALASIVGGFVGFQTLTVATRQIATFDSKVAQLAGASGLPRASAELKGLVDIARDFGVESGFGFNTAADGLLAFIKAGYDATDASSSLAAAFDLSVASGLEVSKSAEVIVQTLAQFGLGVGETERALDAMATTANLTTTDISLVADALAKVGTVASLSGIDIEATNAAIGVLAQRSLQASEAGTALAGVIFRLAAPSSEVRKGLDALGVTIDQVDLKGETLGEALKLLKSRGLDVASANRIFGESYARAALILAESGAEVDALREKILKGDGALKDYADTVGNTLSRDVNRFNAALQELANTAGDGGLIGSFRTLTQEATRFLNALGGRPGAGQGAGAEFGIAEAAATSINAGVDALRSAANQLEKEAVKLGMGDGFDFGAIVREAAAGAQAAQQAAADAFVARTSPTVKLKGGGGQFITKGDGTKLEGADAAEYAASLAGGNGLPATPKLDEFEKSLQFQREVLKLGKEEADLQRQVADYRAAANEEYGQMPHVAAQVTQNYEAQLRFLQQQKNEIAANEAEQRKIVEKAEAIGDAVGQPVRAGLNDAIRTVFEGGEVDGAALGRKLGADIAGGVIDQVLVSPIANALSSVISGALEGILQAAAKQIATSAALKFLLAEDGVVTSAAADIVPYADGGYVTRGPELFPLSGGRIGIRGEAGPEAVVPLGRDRSGKLGIRNVDGGSGGGRTVIFNVYTPDADSFRRSRSHIFQDEARLEKRFQ